MDEYPLGRARKHKKPLRAVRPSLNSAFLAYIFFRFADRYTVCGMQHAAPRVQPPSDVFALQLLLLIQLICNQRILSKKPGRNLTRGSYPVCVLSLRAQMTIRKSDMTGMEKILVYAKGQDQADHVLGIVQEGN
jgi:hypothetical protein